MARLEGWPRARLLWLSLAVSLRDVPQDEGPRTWRTLLTNGSVLNLLAQSRNRHAVEAAAGRRPPGTALPALPVA
jgi:hypothetical protein